MRILVTGAAGFIGSAFVRHVLASHANDEVIGLDLLTYAGNTANLAGVENDPRFRFQRGDIADAALVAELTSQVDAIVNFAAETHVDRSLLDPDAFARANVLGVMTLLEAARQRGIRLLQVSTDEVYGDVPEGHAAQEDDHLRPRSPYSAAKASAELMAQAYWTSYGTDVVITRGCNTIGPYQYPEKLVPLFVTNALMDLPLPVYGDGRQVRNWLHVEDHAAAIDTALRHGVRGMAYNVGADNECENLEVIHSILELVAKPTTLIRHVEDRPGHDRRYSIDTSRVRDQLGWRPRRDGRQTLNDTVDWYVEHQEWWLPIRQRDSRFQEFYERQYAHRLAGAAT